jgi:hypothetical protein
MLVYFKIFHPNFPFFNLVNFDPKKAPESLLSAIYFAGFIIQPNPPEEILSYMNAYAIINIKKMLLTVRLSTAQALGIYSYAFYHNRNNKLSRVCLSHFGRICYALGIGINRKNISVLDQHNWRLIFNYMRLYYNWIKLGPSSYDEVSEDDEVDLDIYEPKYQLPSTSLGLCYNDYEGTIYSIFCSQLAKILILSKIINSKFCYQDSKTIKIKIEELNSKANEIYNNANQALESIAILVPEYKNLISTHLVRIKAIFFVCIICIDSKRLIISKNRNFGESQDILNSCTALWMLITNSEILTDLWTWGVYIVAFNLFQIYPYCSKNQKNTIISTLSSIINFYYKKSFNCNTLNFLILKSQFNLIKPD